MVDTPTTTPATADAWWLLPEYASGSLDLPGQSRLTPRGREALDRLAALAEAGKIAIPQIPRAVSQALAILRSDNAEPEDVSKAVAADPSLVAQMLRYANSAMFATRVPIDNLQRAVMHVGMKRLQSLLLELSVDSITGNLASRKHAAMEWAFARHCALISRSLAVATGQDPDQCYLVGLLRDIGRLAVLSAIERLPGMEKEPKAGSDVEIILESLARAVGSQLAKLWELPPSVVDAVAKRVNGRREDEEPMGQFASTTVSEAAGDICHALGLGRFKRPFLIRNARPFRDIGLDEAAVERFFRTSLPAALRQAAELA